MSVAYRTVCADCRLEAPPLGGDGYVGYPSASERSFDPEDDGLSTFGSIYLGLEAIGMTTLEYDAYLSFLKSHEGHSVRVLSENDADPWETDPGSSAAYRGPSESGQSASGYIRGHFELRCYECRRRRWTEDPDLARERGELEVSASRMQLFVERVMSNFDGDFHDSEPFGFGALELVAGFLERHRGHRVVSTITLAEKGERGAS